jgi:hypothetical protein
MMRAFLISLAFAVILSRTATAQLVNENLLVEVPPGYKIDFKDRNSDRLINEKWCRRIKLSMTGPKW